MTSRQAYMRRLSSMAILSLSLITGPWQAASAAEIKVLSITSVRNIAPDLAAAWEKATGNKVIFVYDSILPVAKRVGDGEAADVAIMPQDRLEALAKQGKIKPETIASIVHVPMAAGVPAGEPKPDIASVEKFKQVLLAVKSLTYPDPANGTPTGLYFPAVIDQLGIADQVKQKIKLSASGGDAADIVAAHGAEIGFASLGDFTGKKVDVLGPIPAELPAQLVYSAGAVAGSHEAQAALSFVKYITSPEAAPVLKAKGFTP
jgi:molybdate transport system substrate-binding protein